jgi:hypothetical protein
VSSIVKKEKSGPEGEVRQLDSQHGMEIEVGGRGAWRLGEDPMMSTSVLKRDALVFGPRRWRPEPRKVHHQLNFRNVKLKMKFVQHCCVAEAAVSKERSNVANPGCDTSGSLTSRRQSTRRRVTGAASSPWAMWNAQSVFSEISRAHEP